MDIIDVRKLVYGSALMNTALWDNAEDAPGEVVETIANNLQQVLDVLSGVTITGNIQIQDEKADKWFGRALDEFNEGDPQAGYEYLVWITSELQDLI